MKLSKRARELLEMIRERTDRFAGGHYVPMAGDGVSGAGDANCLLGLERKGFTKKETTSGYSYSITVAGREVLTK